MITGKAGDLETLLEWNELDPVDEFEIHRNNLIYNNYQLNRNPFIDYPQWARIAYDPSYSGGGASNLLETSSVGNENDPLKNAILSSISVDSSTVKKNYLKGEKFKAQGLEVTAYYNNGESRKTKNYILNIPNDEENNGILLTPGEIEVEVSFTHSGITMSEIFAITVSSQSLSDVLFISEVYGGGGNTGAIYSHDYIEIYNHSDSSMDLTGKSIQQASQASASWNSYALTGEIAAKSFYLIKLASENVAIGEEIPQGDINGNVNIAVGSFKVALVNSTGKLTTTVVKNNSDVIDLVGTGGTVTDYYVAKAPVPSATESIARKFTGGVPSNLRDNSKDYEKAAPSPTNSAISVALNIMSIGNTTNQCYDQYPIFKEKVLSLSESIYEEDSEGDEVLVSYGQRHYFETGSDSRLVVGRARYLAWATHLGDAVPYVASDDYIAPTANPVISNNNPVAFALISSLILTVSGIYFLQRKKLSNQEKP